MTGVVLGAVLPLLEVLPEAMGWGEKMRVVNKLESTLRPRGGAEEHAGALCCGELECQGHMQLGRGHPGGGDG